MRNTAALERKDLSFAAYLTRQRLSRRTRGFARMMVEGFDAADPARASARAIVEEWRGGAQLGAQFRPLGGYGKLLESLAQGVRIQMQTVARSVRWKPAWTRRFHASSPDLNSPNAAGMVRVDSWPS